MTGQFVKGLIVVVIGAGIVSSIDNVLRPAILSGRTQMNGLLMFLSLLGGVSVFGAARTGARSTRYGVSHCTIRWYTGPARSSISRPMSREVQAIERIFAPTGAGASSSTGRPSLFDARRMVASATLVRSMSVAPLTPR